MNTSEDGRRVVDGRFELLGRLGSGGMGTVWRARDIGLQREVALKEVRPADPAMAEANPELALQLRRRAIREAQALARLAHPNVVSIHQIIEPDDGSHPWIVMELVRGGSLYDRIAQGPLPTPDVVRIGLDVLSALRAAHAAGVHHRDVKPANILLRPDGSAVLTDFGIAALRESTSLTAPGDLVGSPEYIAPERVRGQEGNPASDLWSLGMTLYVAAEGAHPLRRETALATVVAVLDEPIPYPARSGGLAPVLGELLVRDTAARPDAERLEALLRGVRAGSPPPPALSVPAGYGPAPAPAAPYAPTPAPAPPVFGPPSAAAGAPHGAVTVAAPVPWPNPRPWARPLIAAWLAAVLVAGVVVAVRAWLPDGAEGKGGTDKGGAVVADRPGPTTSTGGAPAPSGPGTATAPAARTGAGQGDLHTPAGARAMVAAVRQASGGGSVTRAVIYPTYASATVPVKDHPTAGQGWDYRDGAAKKSIITTPVPAGAVLIDLEKVDWDIVPGLIKEAEAKLGVKDPTTRYLIVEPDLFDKKVPTVKVYISNEYHESGYLVAGLDGKVTKTYPVG
ncbi:serine/threonine-protein kinase [Streptomyces sp. NPDC090022]|uniref:serine/threonine-protein kinase n=1 Tax=Streptomyces sp. NPDC090022 TaxID=3365920 RepID=UPI003802834A